MPSIAKLIKWLCAKWTRNRAMLQSTIILNLLEQLAAEPDGAKRIELMRAAERQYHLDMEHQSNFVQARIGALELDIREQVATSLGSTNEMIGQVANDSRTVLASLAANTAALEGLRTETQAGFRGVDARLEEVGGAIDVLRQGQREITSRVDRQAQTLAQHNEAIQSFYQSRQRSTERHDETQAQITALAAQINQVLALVGMDFGFIEAFPDAVLVVEYNGTIVQVNGQAEILFDYHRADLIGQPIETLIPEAMRVQHVVHRTTFVENPIPRRMGHARPGGARAFPARRRDGSQILVEVGLGPFTLGGEPRIIATVREAGGE